MKSRGMGALLVLTFLLAPSSQSVVDAQPGPEHKKLDYLVGKWRSDVDIKASAASAGGKASGTEDCELFANLHVVCRSEATGAAGIYKLMRTVSYVPAVKQYAMYTIDSLGYTVLAMGQVQGNTWTFTTELPGMKLRTTMKTSNDNYTMTSEYAGADGKFVTTMSSRMTRAK